MAINSGLQRGFNLAAFAICGAMLGYAYYSQFVLGLEPCPLCILQRVALLALALIFLLAALHHPRSTLGARVYAAFVVLTAVTGAAIAARHVWLQSLPPDRVPGCGPGLAYMLDAFPLSETLKMTFTGSGECAEITWRLLGLSMPAWVLFGFVALGLFGVMVNWTAHPAQSSTDTTCGRGPLRLPDDKGKLRQ